MGEIKEGDREGDGNYLCASAVQLEYGKNEPVTEKWMREWKRGTKRERKRSWKFIFTGEHFVIDYSRENYSGDGFAFLALNQFVRNLKRQLFPVHRPCTRSVYSEGSFVPKVHYKILNGPEKRGINVKQEDKGLQKDIEKWFPSTFEIFYPGKYLFCE